MEYAPNHITSDDINRYEKMINVIYRRYYHPQFEYLKKDLLQCGRWGVLLALQRYNDELAKVTSLPRYVWLKAHSKMWHYIKHERHHITKEESTYDNEYIDEKSETDPLTKFDIDRAIATLSARELSQLIDWGNYVELKYMGLHTKQNAHKHLKKTFKKLKEKLWITN